MPVPTTLAPTPTPARRSRRSPLASLAAAAAVALALAACTPGPDDRRHDEVDRVSAAVAALPGVVEVTSDLRATDPASGSQAGSGESAWVQLSVRTATADPAEFATVADRKSVV